MASKQFSAKNGTITWNAATVTDVTNINFNDDVDINVQATSSTAGLKSRTVGHKDKSGSFDVQVPSDAAGVATILGFDKGDTGTLVIKSSSTQTLFNGSAIIGNIRYSAPVGGGGNVTATVEWGQA